MDKFLLAENPMIDRGNHSVYIIHTQTPAMIIEAHHEAYAVGDGKMFLTGNYEDNGQIETITLSVTALLICDNELTDEMKERVNKVLNKAWHWYTAYLKWEDEQ